MNNPDALEIQLVLMAIVAIVIIAAFVVVSTSTWKDWLDEWYEDLKKEESTNEDSTGNNTGDTDRSAGNGG